MSNIKEQKYILDPLSTIIKLAILGKKDVGCKISIKNNQIHIQENGIFQGISRYYLGLTKNDIHYLSTPIEIACKKYLNSENLNMILIFKCAQEGLQKLMETYSLYPIIVDCLKYYYSIINKYLNKQKNNIDNKILNENNILLEKTKNIKLNSNEILLLYTNEILLKFDLIWEKSKIQIIINMINYLSKEESASKYAGCIETFMIPIDKEIINIIYENPNITSE